MTTPAYAMKRFWRAVRHDGESLKTFARRMISTSMGHADGRPTTTALWLHRKAAQRRRVQA